MVTILEHQTKLIKARSATKLKLDKAYNNTSGNVSLNIHYVRKGPQYLQNAITAISLILVFLFAMWWFNPLHIPHNFSGNFKFLDILLFIIVSYVVWHPILMEILAWSISSHIKDIRQQKPIPGLKVAFITTIVPDRESLSLLHKCLPAMVNADYKHDTWLLDEKDSPEVKQICRQYGVKHFSRYGNDKYNTPDGKFASKTKGGNHNSWYDAYGNDYDIVAQIDTDFVPKKTFLAKTLGYFRDPKVAFVGTPQIYGNTKSSLVAQGAAEQMYNFYGSTLRGLSGMGNTLLIGANHVIRVAALKDVNHYSAHITEDLLTGMKLHTKGWKSIYLPYPLAIGEGPFTWEAYFNQQMRWAYGCIDILFYKSFQLYKKMGLRRAIYYFFLQQFYFSGIAMALSVCLLSIYFFAGLVAADVNTVTFFIFYIAIMGMCWIMSVWLQRYHVGGNKSDKLLIAGKIISIAAWPVYFSAFISVLRGKRLTYKVTPKGEKRFLSNSTSNLFILHTVFGLISLACLVSTIFTHRQNMIMIYWAACSMVLMFFVPYSQGISIDLSKIKKSIVEFFYSTKDIFNKPDFRAIITPAIHMSGKANLKSKKVSISLDTVEDIIFLSIIGITSFILYISKLGFYSDDWSFQGNFATSPNQSLIGFYQTATTPNTLMRPVQNLYDAALYWLFSANPMGYHLVNGGILVGISILFYLALRRLRVARVIAIVAPILYILLPNYSTDRFWYAAFQANLSMFFYFFSLYAGLRAFSARTVSTNAWKIVSIVSLFISTLSYEVAIPLFLLNMILFWNMNERLGNKNTSKRALRHNQAMFILLTFLSLLYVFLFKVMSTTRLHNGPLQNPLKYPAYIAHIIISAAKVNYGDWGLKLPYIWLEVMLKVDTVTYVTGIIFGMAIFCYIYFIVSEEKSEFPTVSWMRKLTFFSFFIFILGYAIFFTNNNIGFTPTGINNRVAVAGAVGVTFTFIGIVGWISRNLFSDKASRLFFCILIAIMCSGSFFTINTLATYWVAAYNQGQAVLSDIHQTFPAMPHNTTLILDGVCPYAGPAPVFEAHWDLKGALQQYYHDGSLKGDIVTPRLQVAKDGLYSNIYSFATFYPYKNIKLYNFQTKKVYQISSAEEANKYFQKYNPDHSNGCPSAVEGDGVTVL